MPARVPPPNWEKDKLSQYLQLAYNNQLSTAGIKSGIFLKLANIDALIFKIAENIINPSNGGSGSSGTKNAVQPSCSGFLPAHRLCRSEIDPFADSKAYIMKNRID